MNLSQEGYNETKIEKKKKEERGVNENAKGLYRTTIVDHD